MVCRLSPVRGSPPFPLDEADCTAASRNLVTPICLLVSFNCPMAASAGWMSWQRRAPRIWSADGPFQKSGE